MIYLFIGGLKGYGKEAPYTLCLNSLNENTSELPYNYIFYM